MKPPKPTYKIKITILATAILLCSLNTLCQVTENCTYGDQLNKTDHFLDSMTAARWMSHYQQYIDSVRNGLAKFDPNIFPNPQESFNRRYIQKLLDIVGCIGERVFIGIDDKEKMVAILGGIDSCGNTLYITDDNPQTSRLNNKGGLSVRTLRLSSSGGDKGLVELGQFP